MLCLDLNQRPKNHLPYYQVSLDVRGTDLGKKYDCSFVDKYFTNKKDAMKFIKDNGQINRRFKIYNVSSDWRKPSYIQSGIITYSDSSSRQGQSDIYLSTQKERF